MPARSNKRQAVVYFVKRHRAPPGATVTESGFLFDAQQGADREVDVVVRSIVGDDPVIIGVEVTDRKARADVTWVDSQVMKHSHMPTNRLLLVSWSGFTRGAVAKVDAQGGWVEAVTPERVPAKFVDGPKFMQEVRQQPQRIAVAFRVDGEPRALEDIPPQTALFSTDDRREVGSVGKLIERFSSLHGEQLVKDVYHHEERESLSHYTMVNDELESLGLSIEVGGDRLPLLGVSVIGELTVTGYELEWEFWRLGQTWFAMTDVTMIAGPMVYVYTPLEDGTAQVSWRPIS